MRNLPTLRLHPSSPSAAPLLPALRDATIEMEL